jgi:hypothetical protein
MKMGINHDLTHAERVGILEGKRVITHPHREGGWRRLRLTPSLRADFNHNLTDMKEKTLREYMREIAKRGGKACVKRYGKKYMRDLAKKAAAARWGKRSSLPSLPSQGRREVMNAEAVFMLFRPFQSPRHAG